MTKLELRFRIDLLSDYHSGSGHGDGPLVDASLLRDFDDVPVLRGSKIVGLLKDALRDLLDLPPMQDLALTIDDEDADSPIVRLFGVPRVQKVWRFSSARVTDEFSAQKGRWGSQDVTRVRIDPKLRRADPQKLFTQEEGDRRLQFEFTATCYNPNEQDRKDALLMVAAAQMVHHLGSARRRGRGACKIELVDVRGLDLCGAEGNTLTAKAINRFKTVWLQTDGDDEAERGEENQAASSHSTLSAIGNPSTFRRFRCTAWLAEPVILARRGEAGNAYESRDMIPGGVLLGAFAGLAARSLNLQPFDAGRYYPAPPDFITLFLRGGVSASGLLPTDARPGDNQLVPAVPAPHDILVCENYPTFHKQVSRHHPPVFLTLAEPDQSLETCSHDGCDAKLEPLDKSLLPIRGRASCHAFNPARREEAHIRMDRETGRVEEGALFEYIALEAGQYFVGDVVFANDACWRRFQELTGMGKNQKHELYVGRASRRGYGRIEIYLERSDLERSDGSRPTWIQASIGQRLDRNTIADSGFRMTLLTDTIVCDPWSRAYLGFEKSWLADLFGLNSEDLEIDGAAARVREIDSFHGYRRLPRWRDTALMTGSSVGIKINPGGWQRLDKLGAADPAPATEDDENQPPEGDDAGNSGPTTRAFAYLKQIMAELEMTGIGLRRHEGFGRVAFNHPIYVGGREYTLDIPRSLRPGTRDHTLLSEREVLRQVESELDALIDGRKKDWEQIDKWFAPIPFVLFNSRTLDAAQLNQRIDLFSQPSCDYLWGKSVPERDQQKRDKVNTKGIDLIKECVALLAERAPLPNNEVLWRKVLGLLAARIAVQVKKAMEKEGAR